MFKTAIVRTPCEKMEMAPVLSSVFSMLERIVAPGTLEVDVSEFRKLDGGLSCLSLRF